MVTALTTSRQTHAWERIDVRYLDRFASASGIDSSPLILSSIEEERKRMRQRECAVFYLSLYASALND
jgi:hypothetical protein